MLSRIHLLKYSTTKIEGTLPRGTSNVRVFDRDEKIRQWRSSDGKFINRTSRRVLKCPRIIDVAYISQISMPSKSVFAFLIRGVSGR
jgi:hypothetical protein